MRFATVLLPLLLARPAPAVAPHAVSRLAPSMGEYLAARAEWTLRLEEAEAAGEATARLHNAASERLGAGVPPCDDPELRSMIARAAVFSATWRDAAQRARVRAEAVEGLAVAPTVVPLRAESDRTADAGLRARSDLTARAWLEAAAWQGGAEALVKACPGEIAASPGIAREAGASGLVAVIAAGGGVVCPSGLPADGRVVLLDGQGCVAGEAASNPKDCGCAVAPVTPGAVITR